MAFPTNEISATTNHAQIVSNEICEVIKFEEDRYDGVVVDIQNMQNDASRFETLLNPSLSLRAHQEKMAVWIKVPKEQAKLIPVATQMGFWFHHAEPSYVLMVYWIPQTPSTIPHNASHQVGIAVFVFNDQGQVLVIQEKCGAYKDSGLWKMPTGRVNQIDTEFVEVVGFRDGHNASFRKSDLLFVCILRSFSANIVPQDTEISASKWMTMDKCASQPKNQGSKLLKDMIGVCVGNVKGRCKGFCGIEISSNSRKPSAFYSGAVDCE